MKKSFKSIVGLGLVLSLTAASLAGCGTKDTAKSGDDTFLIGGIGPLTGGAASYGVSVKNGAEVAIEEINAAGGVTVGKNKVKLELDFMDDEATPEKSVSAYNTLYDKGAKAILGTVTSTAGFGIIDLTAEDGILQLTPSGSAAGLTKNDNMFRLCFTDPLQGITMANLAKELGYTKIAAIYNNSDDYSTGMMDAFEAQVKANGGELVAKESFVTDDVDFGTQLTAIKNTDAQVIFVPAYYNDAAFITTQAADLGMKLPFLGGDGWDGVLEQIVNPDVLEGAIFLSPFYAAEETPAIQSFVKKFNEKYGKTPDQFAANGYDSIYVFAAALEEAGTTQSADLIAAMTKIKYDGITGSITFNADGEPNKGAKLIEIIGGKYTLKQ